jgi:hypothetical protein
LRATANGDTLSRTAHSSNAGIILHDVDDDDDENGDDDDDEDQEGAGGGYLTNW